MASLNAVQLIGRLTADPEVRQLPSGKTVAKIRLAVGRGRKKPDGTWDSSDTLYIDCEAWHNPEQKRNLPDIIQKYLAKGGEALVIGQLREDTWEDKAGGGKRSKIKVVIDNLELLGGKSDSPPQSSPESAPGEEDAGGIPF